MLFSGQQKFYRNQKEMNAFDQQILRTDVSGMPLEWIGYREAVRLYCQGVVAYTCGSTLLRVHGGINAMSGQRSYIDVNSIVATQGDTRALAARMAEYVPPLNNPALFRRDCQICMYCSQQFAIGDLSRDHVTPMSRGGGDTWNNVVTACRRCNHHKGAHLPEDVGLELIAVPFTPSYAEYIFLQGRRILADQMAFLRAHFPRRSPMHERLSWIDD
jgi:5-methylcytosine-specific restriction endonuclease McrA